jgi:hypothetical protein
LYEKGDYLALREITISFAVPKNLVAKSKFISSARVYATGSNLLYITNFSGPSPEAPVSNGVITGVYNGTYPTPRSFVLGIQAGF